MPLWRCSLCAATRNVHLHSAIRYVTPEARQDVGIVAKRQRIYCAAHARVPKRWIRQTRKWTPIGAVALNPVSIETRSAN
ncbi:MAG: hypothetical protein RL385_6004 [Pseudomonadota bacterium]